MVPGDTPPATAKRSGLWCCTLSPHGLSPTKLKFLRHVRGFTVLAFDVFVHVDQCQNIKESEKARYCSAIIVDGIERGLTMASWWLKKSSEPLVHDHFIDYIPLVIGCVLGYQK